MPASDLSRRTTGATRSASWASNPPHCLATSGLFSTLLGPLVELVETSSHVGRAGPVRRWQPPSMSDSASTSDRESVWDYPRPPVVRSSSRLVEVVLGGEVVCRTTTAVQVLETSHPPTWYLPREDFRPEALTPAAGSSFCEWKGTASYLDVHGGAHTAARAAWFYPHPSTGFEVLAGRVAVYARLMDECRVDGMPVIPQPGAFYGGWITPELVGPFKGEPGSLGW